MNYIFKQEIIDYNFIRNHSTDTILFLHGWGGNKDSFFSTFKLLSTKYNLISITMPTISPTREVWNLMDYVQLVRNILSIYNIKNIIIICHSFGFRIACILKEFITINKIIVTAGAGIKQINIIKKIENENNLILLKYKKFEYLYSKIASDEFKNLSNVNKLSFKNIVNTNTKNMISFKCPMLLFWGKKDTATKYKFAKMIKKKNKAKLISLNSDHFAYLKENAFFNNSILEFLCQ